MTDIAQTVHDSNLLHQSSLEGQEGEFSEDPEKESNSSDPSFAGRAPQGGDRGKKGIDDRGGGRRRDSRHDEEPKEFAEELLGVDRVTRVTAGGRQLRFRASVVIGNGKGVIGFGTGKAGEVQGAIEKAVHNAKKHLVHFPIVRGTIPHDVTVNFKSSALFIHPASPGTGIIAGGAVRKVFAVSGIKDIIAKQHGSPNKITNAQVAILALQKIKPEFMNNHFVKKNKHSVKTSETDETLFNSEDNSSRNKVLFDNPKKGVTLTKTSKAE